MLSFFFTQINSYFPTFAPSDKDALQETINTHPDYIALQNILGSLQSGQLAPVSDQRSAELHAFLYIGLVRLYKKQRPLPADIVVAGQTITIDGNLPIMLQRLYPHTEQSSHFDFIKDEEQRYRELGWMGNFYDNDLPSPEQLDPQYKNTPYRTTSKGGSPVDLNMQATFAEPNPRSMGQKIACRNLSTQVSDDITNDGPQGKVNWNNYRNVEAISKHVAADTENRYEEIRMNASRYDLIENDRLGEHIQSCFKIMAETSQPIKTLAVRSLTHVMLLRLRIKTVRGKLVYVVRFYDPNLGTNKAMRFRTEDLSTVNGHTLKLYIDGSNMGGFLYDSYFKGKPPICMIMDCTIASSTECNRQLSSPLPAPITPTHIFLLLEHNLHIDLARLESQLHEVGKESKKELLNLLFAEGPNGITGLHIAMQNGNTDVVRVLGELLEKFISLFQDLADQVITLLWAKYSGGTSGFHAAMREGHTDLVRQFGEQIRKVIPHFPNHIDQLIEILAAENDHGISALFGLEFRPMIRAYGEVLLKIGLSIPATDRLKLIALFIPRDRNGITFLHDAVIKGESSVIRLYCEMLFKLVELLPENERSAILVEVLAAKNSAGVPALTLTNHRDEMIRMYTDINGWLSKEERSELLGQLKDDMLNQIIDAEDRMKATNPLFAS